MLTEPAQAIHANSIVIDGLVFLSDGSVELLRQGNVNAINATVTGLVPDFDYAMDRIAEWHARLTEPDSPWLLVRTVDDISEARRQGKIGLIMGSQNLAILGGRLNRLELFHRLGLRVMQLTYNEANVIGDGCLEPRNAGLSLFGRKVIAQMNRIGMAIDLSHVGERSCQEAAELSSKPVLLTHANAKAISKALRNKSDAVIKAVARTGGLVGLSVYGPMCWNGDSSRRPQLEDFVRHLEHVVALVGVDHVGLGTDFPAVRDPGLVGDVIKMTLDLYPAAIGDYVQAFGNDIRTRYLEDCSSQADLPAVTEALARRGWKERDIRAFLGHNYLRILHHIWSV